LQVLVAAAEDSGDLFVIKEDLGGGLGVGQHVDVDVVDGYTAAVHEVDGLAPWEHRHHGDGLVDGT
jgi:hypothetical protein